MQWDGARHRKALFDGWINRRVDGRGPSASRQPNHMEPLVAGEFSRPAFVFQVVKADGGGLQKEAKAIAGRSNLEQFVMPARTVPRPTVRHKYAKGSEAFAKHGGERAF